MGRLPWQMVTLSSNWEIRGSNPSNSYCVHPEPWFLSICPWAGDRLPVLPIRQFVVTGLSSGLFCCVCKAWRHLLELLYDLTRCKPTMMSSTGLQTDVLMYRIWHCSSHHRGLLEPEVTIFGRENRVDISQDFGRHRHGSRCTNFPSKVSGFDTTIPRSP